MAGAATADRTRLRRKFCVADVLLDEMLELKSYREVAFLGVVKIGRQFLPANAIHLLPHGIRIRRDIEFIPGKLMVFADSLQQGQAYLMPHMGWRRIVRVHLRLTILDLRPLTARKRLENHAFNLPNMDRTIADII
jgi:imidazoleglycerol phosphate synthase glutamine amidotransferase subunit HisH